MQKLTKRLKYLLLLTLLTISFQVMGSYNQASRPKKSPTTKSSTTKKHNKKVTVITLSGAICVLFFAILYRTNASKTVSDTDNQPLLADFTGDGSEHNVDQIEEPILRNVITPRKTVSDEKTDLYEKGNIFQLKNNRKNRSEPFDAGFTGKERNPGQVPMDRLKNRNTSHLVKAGEGNNEETVILPKKMKVKSISKKKKEDGKEVADKNYKSTCDRREKMNDFICCIENNNENWKNLLQKGEITQWSPKLSLGKYKNMAPLAIAYHQKKLGQALEVIQKKDDKGIYGIDRPSLKKTLLLHVVVDTVKACTKNNLSLIKKLVRWGAKEDLTICYGIIKTAFQKEALTRDQFEAMLTNLGMLERYNKEYNKEKQSELDKKNLQIFVDFIKIDKEKEWKKMLEEGTIDQAMSLLQSGYYAGKTPLHILCSRYGYDNYPEIVGEALAIMPKENQNIAGINRCSEDKKKMTVLAHVIKGYDPSCNDKMNHLKIMKKLIAYGAKSMEKKDDEPVENYEELIQDTILKRYCTYNNNIEKKMRDILRCFKEEKEVETFFKRVNRLCDNKKRKNNTSIL